MTSVSCHFIREYKEDRGKINVGIVRIAEDTVLLHRKKTANPPAAFKQNSIQNQESRTRPPAPATASGRGISAAGSRAPASKFLARMLQAAGVCGRPQARLLRPE